MEEAAPPKPPATDNRLRNTFRYIVAIACVAYIVFYFVEHSEDLRLVLSMPLYVLPIVFVLQASFLTLFAFRLRQVLQQCGSARLPFLHWLQLFAVGRMLSQFVPQMGGVYRSVAVKRDYGVSYTSYVTGAFSFGWMDGCLNLGLALVVIWCFDPGMMIASVGAPSLLLGILGVVLAAPIALNALVKAKSLTYRPLAWAQSKALEVLQVSLGNVRNRSYMLQFVTLGTGAFVITGAVFYVYLDAIGAEVTITAVALFAALLKVSMFINVTPGNIGIREMIYGLLSEQLHMGMSEGIIVSLMVRVVGHVVLFVMALSLGGFKVFRDNAAPSPPDNRP